MKGEKNKDWSGNHGFILLTGILLMIAAIIFLLVWAKLPPQVPWFYSQPWGEGQLIDRLWFGLTLPIMGLVVLVNFLISLKLARGSAVAALVVEGASALLTIIYLASFFRVIAIMI